MAGIDRRIQKTKRLLSESLIALILEKGYEAVTVQHIIDRADVGRSTFYTHYENKEQLLLAGPKNLGIPLFPADGDGAGSRHRKTKAPAFGFLPLFRHAAENRPLAKAMLGKKSGELFLGRMRHQVAEGISDEFKGRFSKSKTGKLWLAYFSDAAAAAVMAMLVAWCEEDSPLSAEEVAARCDAAVAGFFTGAKGA
ncbi:MAG: TetR/AcrR family transcriptional regulator [Fibrobacteria bacterium]